jgi:hypothetical protein
MLGIASLWLEALEIGLPIRAKGLAQLRDSVKLKAACHSKDIH